MRSTATAPLTAFSAFVVLTAAGCGGGGSSAPDPTPRSYSVKDLGQDILAVRMNNRGQIVGGKTVDGVNFHAILLDNGHITDLGALGGNSSIAVAINENGQVVGNAAMPGTDYRTHPFLWENGHIRDIAPQDG